MPPTRIVATFAGFTLLVWATRINNILGDDGLTTGAKAWRVGLALTFVALAAGAIGWIRGGVDARVVGALVVWTTVVWLIRDLTILVDARHTVGFKVVHTVLAVFSIGLGALSWQAAGLPRPRPLIDSL